MHVVSKLLIYFRTLFTTTAFGWVGLGGFPTPRNSLIQVALDGGDIDDAMTLFAALVICALAVLAIGYQVIT